MFKKRSGGVDMVDFTRTKSGKKIAPPKEQEGMPPSVGGFLDFTAAPSATSQPSASAAEAPNTFGFLSDFSQSASTSSSFSGTTPSLGSSSPADSGEVTALKIKIEDLEFKLERLLERLSEMETKFGRL